MACHPHHHVNLALPKHYPVDTPARCCCWQSQAPPAAVCPTLLCACAQKSWHSASVIVPSVALTHVRTSCTLCRVEMFLLEDDKVVVNEIAPRPHNSGHYTMDACETSQFEQARRCHPALHSMWRQH